MSHAPGVAKVCASSLLPKGKEELLCNTQHLALMQIPAGVQICNWTRTGRRWKGAPFQCQPHLRISPQDRADGNMCWHGNWQHLAAVMESGDSAMTPVSISHADERFMAV